MKIDLYSHKQVQVNLFGLLAGDILWDEDHFAEVKALTPEAWRGQAGGYLTVGWDGGWTSTRWAPFDRLFLVIRHR